MHAALDRRDDARGGFWLFVLTLKPQVMLLPLVFSIVHRRWRLLASATAFGVAALVLAGAGLGWRIWCDYLANPPRLERFFAHGTPQYMVSLRGLLALVLGAAADGSGAARAQAALVWGALGVAGLALAAHVEQR